MRSHRRQGLLHVAPPVEVHEDVEGADHEVEAFAQPHAAQVAAHQGEPLPDPARSLAPAGLGAREHRRHRVHADHGEAGVGEGQAHAPGAAAELEDAGPRREPRLGEGDVPAPVFRATPIGLVVVAGVPVMTLASFPERLVVLRHRPRAPYSSSFSSSGTSLRIGPKVRSSTRHASPSGAVTNSRARS